MGAPTERYYYGDFRLWQHGRGHVEEYARQVTLTFDGVDQVRGLVIPVAPSALLDLTVTCMGLPNPASRTQRGWRALVSAINRGLVERSARADPVVWVQDDEVTDTVGGFAAGVVSANSHPFLDADVVLIRRATAGAWSLAAVSNALTHTFEVAPVTGTALHAIQAGDEIFLVEAYWLGMVATLPKAVAANTTDGDWWAEGIEYGFRGSGLYTYARTAAAVGS